MTRPGEAPAPDPEVAALRAQRAASGWVPLYELSLEEARRADREAAHDDGGPPEPVTAVADHDVTGSVAVRVYDPGVRLPAGALVYFYGGGWVLGSIDTADRICRTLANRSGCLVIAPSYRLAPEHPFPAAVDDCLIAMRWVSEQAERLGIEPDRLAVGGDSAGGNLAAVVAQQLRGQISLACQLLIYPITDRSALEKGATAKEDPYFFNERSMEWYWSHYLPDPTNTDVRASPLRAASLHGLPPALVITAELDPLCAQGEAYAQRMSGHGVQVTLHRYTGMIHGFVGMAGVLTAGRRALDAAGDFLHSAIGPSAAP
jgi:acetyl esterase